MHAHPSTYHFLLLAVRVLHVGVLGGHDLQVDYT